MYGYCGGFIDNMVLLQAENRSDWTGTTATNNEEQQRSLAGPLSWLQ